MLVKEHVTLQASADVANVLKFATKGTKLCKIRKGKETATTTLERSDVINDPMSVDVVYGHEQAT